MSTTEAPARTPVDDRDRPLPAFRAYLAPDCLLCERHAWPRDEYVPYPPEGATCAICGRPLERRA